MHPPLAQRRNPGSYSQAGVRNGGQHRAYPRKLSWMETLSPRLHCGRVVLWAAPRPHEGPAQCYDLRGSHDHPRASHACGASGEKDIWSSSESRSAMTRRVTQSAQMMPG